MEEGQKDKKQCVTPGLDSSLACQLFTPKQTELASKKAGDSEGPNKGILPSSRKDKQGTRNKRHAKGIQPSQDLK